MMLACLARLVVWEGYDQDTKLEIRKRFMLSLVSDINFSINISYITALPDQPMRLLHLCMFVSSSS